MNPFLKSIVTLVAGSLLVGADHALTSIAPTGGFAAALASNQALAAVFAGGLILAHNFITHLEGVVAPAPAAPTK